MTNEMTVYHWWCLECGEDWVGDGTSYTCPCCIGEHTVADEIKRKARDGVNDNRSGDSTEPAGEGPPDSGGRQLRPARMR